MQKYSVSSTPTLAHHSAVSNAEGAGATATFTFDIAPPVAPRRHHRAAAAAAAPSIVGYTNAGAVVSVSADEANGYARLDDEVMQVTVTSPAARGGGASADAPKNEAEYKDWLGRTFRHYFEPHEAAGGVPTQLLTDILRSDRNAELLRRGKLSRLMRDMDANADGRISWQEFFDKVTITRKQDLSRGQRFLVELIRAAAPAVETHKKQNKQTFGSDQLDGGEVEEEYDSYLEAYNCRPPPIFIPLSCLAQVICFIVYALELNRGTDESNKVGWTSGLPYYSPLVFDPTKKKEAWRFLSYMLLHCGYHHIVFNLFIQLVLGVPLELVHKCWRVGPVFLIGVLGGSVCSAVFDHTTSLVGASGGCYALMGAHIALVVMNWEELQHDWLNCRECKVVNFLLSGVMRLVMLLLLLGLDFGVALYQRYGLNEDSRVSFLAHVGGLVFGFLVGIPVLKNLEKKPWEAYLFWISLVIAVCLMVAALLYLCIAELLGRY